MPLTGTDKVYFLDIYLWYERIFKQKYIEEICETNLFSEISLHFSTSLIIAIFDTNIIDDTTIFCSEYKLQLFYYLK